jgi:NitT/TauT family transport system permease protein/taurine transport system permease protein
MAITLANPATEEDTLTSPPRRRRRLRGLRQTCYVIASFAIGLIAWQIMSVYIFGHFLVPPPLDVARTFIPMSASGEIFHDIAISLARVAIGYITGAAFALLLGLFMGRMRVLHDLLDPLTQYLRFLSPTAMIPIVVIWFGIGEMSKYVLIFWGTVFIVLVNTVAGVLRTPVVRQHAALCLGASEAQIFRLIVLPSSIPTIVIGMRLALSSAFISIIPAELLAADSGLGYLLQQSSLLLQTNRIYVALVTICTVGFLADRLFQFLVATLLRRYMAVT